MATDSSFEGILHRLGNLRVDVSTGDPAPHKPLLLLVVIELAERGELAPILELTPQLAFRFCSFFSIVAYRRQTRPDIRLPFHHLGSDQIWMPLIENERISPDRKLTRKAKLSDEFLALCRDSSGREVARRLIIAKYFRPNERIALYSLVGIVAPEDQQTAADARLGERIGAVQAGRDARFRIEVVAAYDYTCALTGHRLLTIDAGSIVEAAHIHAFADSRNNDPRNGLALSKNAHWAFDEGLWTVDDEFRVLVAADSFAEANPDGRTLSAYHGVPLRLPSNRSLSPNPEYIAWHRRKRFVGTAAHG